MKRVKEVIMMCFNMVIINLKGQNNYRNIIKYAYDEFSHNKDGLFLYNSFTNSIVREVGTDIEYRQIIDNHIKAHHYHLLYSFH